MMNDTTKPDSLQPAAGMAVDLFDNWFDPIESEVRARAREFIEEMIRGELDTVLARPRYGRGQISSDEESAVITGHRHGSRKRSLTGTFGPIEIAVPRARLNTPDGKTTEWKSQALRAYQRRTLAADALIASRLSGWHQHAPGAPCARRPVWRCVGQGYGANKPSTAADRNRPWPLNVKIAAMTALSTSVAGRARGSTKAPPVAQAAADGRAACQLRAAGS
jgi:hypothetical protein